MDLTPTAMIHSNHEQVSYTTKSTSIVMILSLITKNSSKTVPSELLQGSLCQEIYLKKTKKRFNKQLSIDNKINFFYQKSKSYHHCADTRTNMNNIFTIKNLLSEPSNNMCNNFFVLNQ